jgi:hypothetical protein
MSEGESTYKCASCVKALHSIGDETAYMQLENYIYLGASEENIISREGAYFTQC